MSGSWALGSTIPDDTTISVPAGETLTISEAVDIGNRVTFTGGGTIVLSGAGQFQAAGDDVTFDGITVQSATPVNLLQLRATGAFTGWAFTDCIFDNVAVHCTAVDRVQNDGSVTTSGSAVVAATFTDTEHRNYAGNYAVQLGGVTVTMLRPWVHHNGVDIDAGDGIKVLANSTGCQILDGTLEHNTRDGVDIYDSQATTVDGCTIRDNGGVGVDAKWGSTDPNPSAGHTITGNTVERNGGGINASTSDTTISGNTCTDNGGWGIRVGSSHDDATDPTINTDVLANTCTGSGYGIVLGNAVSAILVDGNTCTGNDYGIGLSALSDSCTITGNVLNPNAVDDLLNSGTNHTISGNT